MKLALPLLVKHWEVGRVVYAAWRSKDAKPYAPQILELLPNAGESAAAALALAPWLDALHTEMRTLLDTFKTDTVNQLGSSICQVKKRRPTPSTTEFVGAKLDHHWRLDVSKRAQFPHTHLTLSLAVEDGIGLISSIAFGPASDQQWTKHKAAWKAWGVPGCHLYEKWEKEYEGEHWYPVAIEKLPKRSKDLKVRVSKLSEATVKRILGLCDRGRRAAI